jgi:hypothetical protein
MASSMDETFTLDDLDLLDRDAGRRFLDFYGDEGLRRAFEAYGLFDALRERGWGDFRLATQAQDERHTLLLDGKHGRTGREDRLLELVVRRDRLVVTPTEGYDGALSDGYHVLTVDWLCLRNPTGHFHEHRMRLPGQDAPGLGVGERVLEMLYRVVDRLSLDGLVTVAEYLHNALLYARELPFVDPWYQGQLDALRALCLEREGLSFPQATWAMHWGYVLDVDDRVVRWTGQAMIQTHQDELTAYLGSDAYAASARRTAADLRYHLRRTAFDEQWARERGHLLEFPSTNELKPS